jgi:uncharacterized protein with PQ loop repeat
MSRADWAFWLGWVGTILALAMFSSQIDQALKNLKGAKGSILLPSATIVNCVVWTIYGFVLEPVNWPLIICNGSGVPLGIFTVFTAIRSRRHSPAFGKADRYGLK